MTAEFFVNVQMNDKNNAARCSNFIANAKTVKFQKFDFEIKDQEH